MKDILPKQGFDDIPPDASAMAEAMRAYGYSLATAVADLIDNSISADARIVDVRFNWAGRGSFATIADDGSGMSESCLRDAMRLGSSNPLHEREEGDLGRFGLGLKTASFAQCRRLTVLSKEKDGHPAIRRWDLDHLADPTTRGWQLLRDAKPGSAERLVLPSDSTSGTVVLWELMDRVVGDANADDSGAQNRFYRELATLENHLGMVFHRFLETPRNRLVIRLNNNEIKPWDPFATDHASTRSYPLEAITIEGVPGRVEVAAYVLPHKYRLGEERHKMLSGPGGWNSQQGFYLYRNERLIVPGSWLGLGNPNPWTKEEHYKLARIRLDIPNSMDHLWQLDVKKSSAKPPGLIRDRLKDLALRVRKDARGVFAHRGRYGARAARPSEIRRAWKAEIRNNVRRYRVDRGHPVIAAMLADLDADVTARVESILRLVEESVPVEEVWLNKAEDREDITRPFQTYTDSQLHKHILGLLDRIEESGNTRENALAMVLCCDEYTDERTRAIIQSIAEEIR